MDVDVCFERGGKCGRVFELLPSASPRLQTVLTSFRNAYLAGDYTLAENRVLLLQNHPQLKGRYTQYLLALTDTAQGHIGDVRARLDEMAFNRRFDELDESCFWLRVLLDYCAGDWIAFNENAQIYLLANLIDGCACLYQARSHFLRALIALRENAYLAAMEHLHALRFIQRIFPLLGIWGRLGEIEIYLRLGNTMTAMTEIQQLAQALGHDKPLSGWQLFFPLTLQAVQRQRIDWYVPNALAPVQGAHQVFPETSPSRVFLFGHGRVFWGNQEVFAFAESPDARQLLAYLALKPEGATGHEILMDLWPDRVDEAAAFSELLDQMQTWTPEPLIRHSQGIYYARRDLWVDTVAYSQRYNEVRQQRSIPALLEVRQLYTAPFLHGLNSFWADELRTRFQLMQSWLHWNLSQLYREQHNYAAAQQMLEASIDGAGTYTFDRGMNDLMRLLEEMGLRSEALRRYEQYRQRIQAIYGVTPAPHLQELARRLQQEETQVTGAFQASDLARAARTTYPAPPALSSSITQLPIRISRSPHS